MDNKELTPKIRFSGFTDLWEQRKLDDLGTTYTGLSGKTKEDFGHGAASFVTYMNVFLNPVTDAKRVESVEIDKTQNTVRYGDVFFTTSSETPEEVGMSSVWLENTEDTYLNSFCFGYRPTAEIDPYYMAYMLRSESVRKKIIYLAQGISRYNISKNGVMQIEIPIPNNDEQKSIGKYFKHLDNLITLHQRKYEKLQNIKKSMLEKMFPRDGSNIPEVRFAGFTDPWEQRKFSEVFVGLQNNTLSRADLNYNQGDIKNVHYGDVLIKFGEYIDAASAELPYINDSSIESKFTKSLLKNGDIIIADTAEDETVGKCCEITNSDGMKLLSGLHTIAVRPQQKYASKFLGYYLNSNAYHSQLLPLMQGIKVTSISKGALQDTVLTVPVNLDEQEKIGECLSHIDDIITLHQRKLEKLKNIKKSMLESMFV
ncbi:MAG: restriction endonuclease subunit S [Clostridiales bacterium]|nr:restriction endonuclease subunit S [Clostridiales bacterium]